MTHRPISHNEPVALAEAVRLVLLALAAVGVIAIDSTAIDAVVAAVAAVVSVGLTAWTRGRVSPAASTGRHRWEDT